MPKRNMRRVDSTEVQGEGSYVEFRGVPYAMYREWMKRLDASPRDERGNAQVRFAENDSFLAEMIGASVAAWNWVDDDGKPLALPVGDFSLSELTTDEVNWLAEHATAPRGSEAKN